MAEDRKRNPLLEEDEDEGGQTWLLTYSDMITLLLAFFVVLIAVSRYDINLFDNMQQGMLAEFTGQDIEDVQTPLSQIMRDLEELLEDEREAEQVEITMDHEGIELYFESEYFYASGEAEFLPDGEEILTRVGQAMEQIDYYDFNISVEGHTDNVPINTLRFRNNWELSVSRSSNVVKKFIDLGIDAERLRASGYADTRPVAPNVDEDGNPIPENQARNRRVVIRIFY